MYTKCETRGETNDETRGETKGGTIGQISSSDLFHFKEIVEELHLSKSGDNRVCVYMH